MDLRHRGGRQRRGVDACEDLSDRPTESLGDGGLDDRPRFGGHLRLQGLEFTDEHRREDVSAGREHLSELDEGHPRLGEGFLERPRGLDLSARRIPAEAAQLGAEPVPHRNGYDLGIAAGAATAGPPPEEQRLRARQGSGRKGGFEHDEGADAQGEDPPEGEHHE